MKEKIDNISFKTYLELSDKSEYDYILRYSNKLKKGLDLFNYGEFIDLSFGFVKDMQETMNTTGLSWQHFIEIISKEKGLTLESIALIPLFDLQQARSYFREQVEFINELETKGLGHMATAQQEAAGIDIFNKYRSFIQLDKLAGGDPTKYKAIEQLDYMTCFTKLKLEADKDTFNERLTNLMKK